MEEALKKPITGANRSILAPWRFLASVNNAPDWKELWMLPLIGGVLMLPVLCFLTILALHDPLARRNTQYSSHFSDTAFSRVTVGSPRSAVVQALGAPLESHVHEEYPVWAVRDESTRQHYGRVSFIHIEVLSFTQPADSHADYDLAQVTIGPDSTVIETARWITD